MSLARILLRTKVMSTPRARDPLILVVDDDLLVRRAIVRELRRIGVVIEAEDAEQALILTKSLAPDLVISDCEMPGMRGTELLTHIRALRPTTRRMLVSGNARTDEVRALQDDGTVEVYLPKPTTSTDLRAAVRALLDGK